MSKRELFGVVRSSYYYGIQSKPTDVELIKLKALIRQIFNGSKQPADARSSIAILWQQRDVRLTHHMAGKVMAQIVLKAVS